MPITDEEKLNYAKQAFKAKIMQLETWDSFKNMVQNITPSKIKTLVVTALALRKQSAEASVINAGESVDDIEALGQEVSNL